MSNKFKYYALRVRLREDLHTGTGTGLRGIDSATALDRHGRPVIRATHLRGVLRAQAEELVAAEAERVKGSHAKPKYTSKHVDKLFGPKEGYLRGALVQQSLYVSSDVQID